MKQHLVNRVMISPIFVTLVGISGYIIAILAHFLKLKSVLDVFWDLPRMKGVKCLNMS